MHLLLLPIRFKNVNLQHYMYNIILCQEQQQEH